MGKNSGLIEKEGVVLEALPSAIFKILLDGGDTVLGVISGKLRRFNIRVLPGDRVRMEFSEYDATRGRITYRLK